jgi:Bacterial archaeo-eukaryotic release factor family 3
LTIVAPIPNPAELTTRLKNMVRGAQRKLADRGAGSDTSASLLEPVKGVAAVIENKGIWANTLVLLRSPEVFTYYMFYEHWKESLTVVDRFQIRPLLSALTREQRFHLLCLSQRRIRLFHGTQRSIEEAVLEGAAPQDMRLWMNTRTPDHVLDNRSSAGPSAGSMKGVMFGTSNDRDWEDEYFSHFFKEVDRGVNAILRNDTAPLVLVGVENEVAIYRHVNTYPRLLEKTVHGSPDSLAPKVLHTRAREIVTHTFSEPLQKALAEFQKQRDKGRVSIRRSRRHKSRS